MARILKYLESIPSRTVEYFVVLGNDYKTAMVDAFKDAKNRPIRTGAITAFIAGLTYAYKTNPTEE